jgi:hypothetical protein
MPLPLHNYYKMNQGKLFQVLQPVDFERLQNYPKYRSVPQHLQSQYHLVNAPKQKTSQ